MAGRYAHPFPVGNGTLPFFGTKHGAREFLAEYQERGFIRRCAHARVRLRSGEGFSVPSGQHSFQVLTPEEPGAAYESDAGVQYAADKPIRRLPQGLPPLPAAVAWGAQAVPEPLPPAGLIRPATVAGQGAADRGRGDAARGAGGHLRPLTPGTCQAGGRHRPRSRVLTHPLLCDLESLLIYHVQP
jgi:hypothetical protein